MRQVSRCASSPLQLYTRLLCVLKVIDRGGRRNQILCIKQRHNSERLLSRTSSWPWLHLEIPTMKTENRDGHRGQPEESSTHTGGENTAVTVFIQGPNGGSEIMQQNTKHKCWRHLKLLSPLLSRCSCQSLLPPVAAEWEEETMRRTGKERHINETTMCGGGGTTSRVLPPLLDAAPTDGDWCSALTQLGQRISAAFGSAAHNRVWRNSTRRLSHL